MVKIKLIIFDLDGVLVDSRKLHYEALNSALRAIDEKYTIGYKEHLAKYDGLPTKKKLEILTREKNLPVDLYDRVWSIKQDKTIDVINKVFTYDERICSLLRDLKNMGYFIYCASNSIWNTVKTVLLRTGCLEYVDFLISNEEVKNPKPFPEMYLKCIERSKLSTREVMICEDSPIGRESAIKSGAHLCPIKDPSDLTLKKIVKYIKRFENETISYLDTKWIRDINVVVPMSGCGSRFADAGYIVPKPLININGKSMIQIVVENLNIAGQYIFIVQKNHFERYSLDHLLNKIAPGCKIIQVDNVTEGAACSVLLAEEFINNDTPLLIANCDQYLEWDSNQFLYFADSDGIDGCISTFYSTDPKWSYVKLNSFGLVTEVQEKKPISTIATTGIYFWKKGKLFVKYAKQMIEKNIRVNNEFYVCPVYNEAILDGKNIKIMDCKTFWSLGTPNDLNFFLAHFDLTRLS